MKIETILKTLIAGCASLCGAAVFAQGIPTVSVADVSEVTETGIKQYIGRLSAIQDVALPARVSGKLIKCNFKEGDFVKKGDLLMVLEKDIYEAALESAKAQLLQAKAQITQANAQITQSDAQISQANAQIKQAEANLKYANDALERANKLRHVDAEKSHDAAVRDYDLAVAQKAAAEGNLAAAVAAKAAAEGNLAAAKAAEAAAKASLKNAEINLSYTDIYADFAGKIGKATYSEGNYVTPSSGALAQLVQFDPIYVKFSISEPDFISGFGTADALKKDAVVRIKLSDRSLYDGVAAVTIVDNKIDQSTGTLMLWAKMDNKNLRLTPGAVVDVLLTRKNQEKKPAVPVSAIQIGPQGQFVYVLNPADNSVLATPVVPGEIVGDLQIVSGITPGQTVVIDGMHKIMPIPGKPSTVNPVRK